MKVIFQKIALILGFSFSHPNIHAGINWSNYNEGPEFFLGWETSFYFAIVTIMLFGLSWVITNNFKRENGSPEGYIGCFVGLINVAMIICAICSFYLLLPLGIIYTLIKCKKE